MDLAAVEEEARALVRKHVVPEYEWYERHSRAPWLWYRSLGILVILLGVAIPLLTLGLEDGPDKQIKVSAFSVETAGVLDRDCELEPGVTAVGKVRFEIKGSFDIVTFNKIVSRYVLG